MIYLYAALLRRCPSIQTVLATLMTPLRPHLLTSSPPVPQGPEAISGHFKAMEAMARGNRHLTANLIIDAGDAVIDNASGVTKVARASSYRLLHKVRELHCALLDVLFIWSNEVALHPIYPAKSLTLPTCSLHVHRGAPRNMYCAVLPLRPPAECTNYRFMALLMSPAPQLYRPPCAPLPTTPRIPVSTVCHHLSCMHTPPCRRPPRLASSIT